MAASTTPFFDAIQNRRTIYHLTDKSTISDVRIHEIVSFAIKHVPSAFNVQSARAVVLLGEQNRKLWDIGDVALKNALPPPAYEALAPKVQGFRGAYGSVLWFEDQEALQTMQGKNPAVAAMIPEWSAHSTGMHQFTVWTAFEVEGLGCNLQHYNFSPEFKDKIQETWGLPKSWDLHAQLVFGQPTGAPLREKTFQPLEERVKVFN